VIRLNIRKVNLPTATPQRFAYAEKDKKYEPLQEIVSNTTINEKAEFIKYLSGLLTKMKSVTIAGLKYAWDEESEKVIPPSKNPRNTTDKKGRKKSIAYIDYFTEEMGLSTDSKLVNGIQTSSSKEKYNNSIEAIGDMESNITTTNRQITDLEGEEEIPNTEDEEWKSLETVKKELIISMKKLITEHNKMLPALIKESKEQFALNLEEQKTSIVDEEPTRKKNTEMDREIKTLKDKIKRSKEGGDAWNKHKEALLNLQRKRKYRGETTFEKPKLPDKEFEEGQKGRTIGSYLYPNMDTIKDSEGKEVKQIKDKVLRDDINKILLSMMKTMKYSASLTQLHNYLNEESHSKLDESTPENKNTSNPNDRDRAFAQVHRFIEEIKREATTKTQTTKINKLATLLDISESAVALADKERPKVTGSTLSNSKKLLARLKRYEADFIKQGRTTKVRNLLGDTKKEMNNTIGFLMAVSKNAQEILKFDLVGSKREETITYKQVSAKMKGVYLSEEDQKMSNATKYTSAFIGYDELLSNGVAINKILNMEYDNVVTSAQIHRIEAIKEVDDRLKELEELGDRSHPSDKNDLLEDIDQLSQYKTTLLMWIIEDGKTQGSLTILTGAEEQRFRSKLGSMKQYIRDAHTKERKVRDKDSKPPIAQPAGPTPKEMRTKTFQTRVDREETNLTVKEQEERYQNKHKEREEK